MDPDAGKTPEQLEAEERARETARLSTREGQAREFRDAISQALNTVNLELSAQGIRSRTDAVSEALTMVQADFVAMLPHRNERRLKIAEILDTLQRLVAFKLANGTKPAAELPPDEGSIN